MPEAAEVRVVADVIEKGINKSFSKIEIIENIPGKLHRFSRNPIANLALLQSGFMLEKVSTRGKLICMRLGLANQEKLYVLNTLGMSGSWKWNAKKDKHTRLAFINDVEDLSFVDIRCYGTFKLANLKQTETKLKSIGIDLLKAPAKEDQWAKFQNHPKLRNKPLGEALMDQSLFSGLGNIYVSETIFSGGLDPTTLVRNVPSEKWNSLNLIAHTILKKAYELGGSSVDMFEADGKLGEAQNLHQVYGKSKCPLGHPISKIKMGDRTKWFCSLCQV